MTDAGLRKWDTPLVSSFKLTAAELEEIDRADDKEEALARIYKARQDREEI